MKRKGGWRLVASRFGDLFFLSAAGRRYTVARESVDPSFVRGAVDAVELSPASANEGQLDYLDLKLGLAHRGCEEERTEGQAQRAPVVYPDEPPF